MTAQCAPSARRHIRPRRRAVGRPGPRARCRRGAPVRADARFPAPSEALDALEAAGIPYRVVTNYSLAHRETLAAGVSRQFGRPVRASSIITAASAAAGHTARHHPGERLFVLASPDALREWDGQRVVGAEEAADLANLVGAVVIGDAGDELSFHNLNVAFRAIRAGAAFVAMHLNPWWITPRWADARFRIAHHRARARPRAARDHRREALPGRVPRGGPGAGGRGRPAPPPAIRGGDGRR